MIEYGVCEEIISEELVVGVFCVGEGGNGGKIVVVFISVFVGVLGLVF